MKQSASANYYSLLFIFTGAISTIGLFTSRDQSLVIGTAYIAGFISYFWLVSQHPDSKLLFGLGLTARVILFFTMPTLSDDVYRFIWDGLLNNLDLNPYLQTPKEVLDSGKSINLSLYELLNSKEYYTVYPPLNQLLFWLSVKIGGTNWLMGTNILRSVLLIAEISSFFLLKEILVLLKRKPDLAHWYWLNPLVILEIVGNVHFEGFVITFILLGIWCFLNEKTIFSGTALGLAIGTKLLPLIFLPAMLLQQNWRKGLMTVIIAGLVGTLSLSPLLFNDGIQVLRSSLNLYFQHFEFNASIYYLLREIGFATVGYNIIAQLGPALSIITAILILALCMWGHKKKWPFYHTLLFSLLAYLSLATTVHPWYTLILIPLGLLSNYRFPIAWTFLIFATYMGYQSDGFELSPVWLVAEYVTLWLFIGAEFYLKSKDDETSLSQY